MIQQQVQFDRPLRPPKLRPVKHAHRQVDDAPVQAHQLVLETELLPSTLAAHQFLAFEQRLLEHRLVQFPRPMLIRIGQRGLLGRHRHSQMLQLAFATRQPPTNLAQRMRPSQLAEQHGHKLAPTGETPCVSLGLVLLDRLFEIPTREKLQHLRKYATYFVHRLSLLETVLVLAEPNPAYQGLSLSPVRKPSSLSLHLARQFGHHCRYINHS